MRGKERILFQKQSEVLEAERQLIILKQCLEDLEKFCKNLLITTSIEHEASSYGKLNPARQKVLFEQYFIDVIADLVKELMCEDELK